MQDPVESQGLSLPWKTFLTALPVLLVVFFFLYGGQLVVALTSAIIWSAVLATIVRVTSIVRSR